jgi:hypothetical protein
MNYCIGDKVLMGPHKWQEHQITKRKHRGLYTPILPDQIAFVSRTHLGHIVQVRDKDWFFYNHEHDKSIEDLILGPAFEWDEEIEVALREGAEWEKAKFITYIPTEKVVHVLVENLRIFTVFRKIQPDENSELISESNNKLLEIAGIVDDWIRGPITHQTACNCMTKVAKIIGDSTKGQING